jgi:Polyketide cyclase / dehydrase and lipid transport
MRRRSPFAALGIALLTLAPATAPADVVDVGENGFTIRETAAVSADAARAWEAAVDVGKWWDPEHTYSHDSANLTLDARPGGCWCEKLPGKAGVAHMTVLFADPGKLLRLSGGLGPLQSMAVNAVMTWTFQPGDKGTKVDMTYVAGGYNREGFKDLAPGIDAVLHAQIERYRRYVNTGKP